MSTSRLPHSLPGSPDPVHLSKSSLLNLLKTSFLPLPTFLINIGLTSDQVLWIDYALTLPKYLISPIRYMIAVKATAK
jgi:hypothetical protein